MWTDPNQTRYMFLSGIPFCSFGSPTPPQKLLSQKLLRLPKSHGHLLLHVCLDAGFRASPLRLGVYLCSPSLRPGCLSILAHTLQEDTGELDTRKREVILEFRGSLFILKITSVLRTSHRRQIKVIGRYWPSLESSGECGRLKSKPTLSGELDHLLATALLGGKTWFRKCLPIWCIFLTAWEATSQESKTMWTTSKLNRHVVFVLGQAHSSPEINSSLHFPTSEE